VIDFNMISGVHQRFLMAGTSWYYLVSVLHLKPSRFFMYLLKCTLHKTTRMRKLI